jgi:hypothetical protein
VQAVGSGRITPGFQRTSSGPLASSIGYGFGILAIRPFKKVQTFWSARITDDYRALGVLEGDTVIWFWIGTHEEYERLMHG